MRSSVPGRELGALGRDGRAVAIPDVSALSWRREADVTVADVKRPQPDGSGPDTPDRAAGHARSWHQSSGGGCSHGESARVATAGRLARRARRVAVRVPPRRAARRERRRLLPRGLGLDGIRDLAALRLRRRAEAAHRSRLARPGDDGGSARLLRVVRAVGPVVAVGAEHARRVLPVPRLRRPRGRGARRGRAPHGAAPARRRHGGDHAALPLRARHARPPRPARGVRVDPGLSPHGHDRILERPRDLRGHRPPPRARVRSAG